MGVIDSIRKRFNFQDTSKDTKLEQPHYYYPRGETQRADYTLPRKDLGTLVMREPMIRKGIWKENKDIFGEGWTVQNHDPDIDMDDNDLDLIESFDKKAGTKYKLEQAGISANIYGDGFIELIFEEPEETTIDMPIPLTPPKDLNVLKAEYIYETEELDDIKYYIFKETQKQYMHPDRILHIVKKRLPGHLFGISDVFTCARVLQSCMNADISFGEFIDWAGKGVFTLKLNGASQTELDEAEQKVKRQNVQIFNEDAEWGVLNPTTMSPKEYYDYFFIKIAATLDMPQHILTGVQPGQLTGSEIGLADYYKNIINLQELIFTPILERIYKLVLEGNGRSFDDYKIVWNPIYIDENSEAQILLARSQAGALLHDRFVINDGELRQIAREGIQNLSGEQVLSVEKPAIEPVTPEDIIPTDVKSEEEQLSRAREKRLNELEMILQDKRIEEAKRRIDAKKRK